MLVYLKVSAKFIQSWENIEQISIISVNFSTSDIPLQSLEAATSFRHGAASGAVAQKEILSSVCNLAYAETQEELMHFHSELIYSAISFWNTPSVLRHQLLKLRCLNSKQWRMYGRGGGHCDMSPPASWTEGALLRWMHFLCITPSFLTEGALIDKIRIISPHKMPAIKNYRASPDKNVVICLNIVYHHAMTIWSYWNGCRERIFLTYPTLQTPWKPPKFLTLR